MIQLGITTYFKDSGKQFRKGSHKVDENEKTKM